MMSAAPPLLISLFYIFHFSFRIASFASSSQRLFSVSLAWPLVQRQVTSCLPVRARSSCHSSAFLTGCFSLVRQPLRCQPTIQEVMPFLTYSLSVTIVTRQRRLSWRSPSIAARNSIRLLVVAGSAPESSRRCLPARRTTPQPPGPGLPLQAPSV